MDSNRAELELLHVVRGPAATRTAL